MGSGGASKGEYDMNRIFGFTFGRALDQAGVFLLLAPALVVGLATLSVGGPV